MEPRFCCDGLCNQRRGRGSCPGRPFTDAQFADLHQKPEPSLCMYLGAEASTRDFHDSQPMFVDGGVGLRDEQAATQAPTKFARLRRWIASTWAAFKDWLDKPVAL